VLGVIFKELFLSIDTAIPGWSMTAPDVPPWEFDDEFDGGEETCGRVIVNLYLYIRDQEPGRRLLVISRDPGAPVELPAWCRMTRNTLTAMRHPYYLITLKPELIAR
jgi:TusA-related sulfurtransferase